MGLEPKVKKGGPAVLTVNEKTAMQVLKAELTPEQIYRLRYKEAGNHGGRGMGAVTAAERAAAERQFRQDDYAGWYAKETGQNGCSVPAVVQDNFPTGNWDAHTEACNRHDVNYGRGGILMKPVADVKLAWEIWKKGDRLKAIATYYGLEIGGIANYSWLDIPGDISSGPRWKPLPTPAEEAANRAAAAKAVADKQAAEVAAHKAALARGNEIIGGVLIKASPNGGENAFARQALRDAGITDRGEQDQALQDWFNRDKTDMK